MKRIPSIPRWLAAPAVLALGALLWAAALSASQERAPTPPPLVVSANVCNPCAANPCAGANPCAMQNPCAANPCAKKNPCAANPCAANPCAANPCAAANPCGGNPCGANPCDGGGGIDARRFKQPSTVRLAAASPALVEAGERLWNDPSLGNSGLACATCHVGGYAQMNASFASPYPHAVAMPKQQAGVDEVNAAEMVNFCMLVPMASEPLAWDSKELASLAAYVEHLRSDFVPGATPALANPCAADNPCALANPCAGNPCAANACNPCAAKNPCGR